MPAAVPASEEWLGKQREVELRPLVALRRSSRGREPVEGGLTLGGFFSLSL